jgi:hypothetical protein
MDILGDTTGSNKPKPAPKKVAAKKKATNNLVKAGESDPKAKKIPRKSVAKKGKMKVKQTQMELPFGDKKGNDNEGSNVRLSGYITALDKHKIQTIRLEMMNKYPSLNLSDNLIMRWGLQCLDINKRNEKILLNLIKNDKRRK